MSGTLTLSGNEITDAVRSADVQGDGAAVPGGVGVWEGTTNLCTNGGFESGVTPWAPNQTVATLSQDTTRSKFGSASLKIVVGSPNTYNSGAYMAGIAVTAGYTYTLSYWQYAPVGASINCQVNFYDSGGGFLGNIAVAAAGTGAWQYVQASGTAPANAATALLLSGTTASSVNWWIDGVQFEQKPFATPFVETNGATAIRNGASVQFPASLLNTTQGWIAMSVRMGWSNPAVSTPALFWWQDDTTHRLLGVVSGDSFYLERANGTTDEGYSANYSWSAGETMLVVFAWDASQIHVSVNGGAFVSAASTHVPSLAASTVFLGVNNSGGNLINGSILWAACGTGTLTNADAAAFYARGSASWSPEDFDVSGGAACTFAWPAVTSSYLDETFTILDPDGNGYSRGIVPRLRVDVDVTNPPTNPTRVWTDVTKDIRSLQHTRAGRNDELQQTQPGTLTAVFSNTTAKYDPENPAGLGIRRRQWIRVRARWDQVVYPRWQGVIGAINQSWPQAGRDAIATITAGDSLKIANLYDLYGDTFVSQTSDQRVLAVANLLGVSANLLDTGVSTLVAVDTPFPVGSPAATHLTDVEETENGVVYADENGEIAFQSRHYRIVNETVPLGTIGDGAGEIPYTESAAVTSDDAYITSVAYVTPTNADGSSGTVQTATNAASASEYFTSAPSQMNRTILVSSEAETAACAQYLVNRYGDPSPRIPVVELVLDKATAKWPTVLSAENGSRFTFKRRAAYSFAEDVYVERVGEKIVPNTSWRPTFQLSPADDSAGWVLGNATNGLLGETTKLNY